MAKRRVWKHSPSTLRVIQVKWVDARTTGMSDDGRQLLTVELPELWTVGMVVYEDDKQYALASEIEAHDDYMNDGQRTIQVPKAWIIEIRELGSATVYEQTSEAVTEG